MPALSDNDGRFVASKGDAFSLQTKPHGHGDLHALLHASGIAAKWQREGRRWVFLFQDSSTLYEPSSQPSPPNPYPHSPYP